MWFRAWASDAEDVRVLRAARELGVERFAALGVLTAIRCWAVQHAPDGEADDIEPEHLAWVIRWDGSLDALRAVVPLALDGWEERAEGYRRAAAARERRARDRPKPKPPKQRKPEAQTAPKAGAAPEPEAPKPEPARAPEAPEARMTRREPTPPPSTSPAPIVAARPLGGAVAAWSAEGRPLLRCSGEPSEVLQWDYLAATYGHDVLVGWLVSPDAARRLSRVHPGSLHRAIEGGISRAKQPTIADRLATDAALEQDPRRQAALAGASALCAAVGRIEERRARQIAAELASADIDGEALSADEVLGGVRAYASERAVLRRSARDGQVDPPEAFDVVHAVKRFARDERAKRAPVPQPQPEAQVRTLAIVPHAAPAGVEITSPAPLAYVEGEDERAAIAIRRANGLDRTDEDHQRGLESIQSVLRAMRGGRG